MVKVEPEDPDLIEFPEAQIPVGSLITSEVPSTSAINEAPTTPKASRVIYSGNDIMGLRFLAAPAPDKLSQLPFLPPVRVKEPAPPEQPRSDSLGAACLDP